MDLPVTTRCSGEFNFFISGVSPSLFYIVERVPGQVQFELLELLSPWPFQELRYTKHISLQGEASGVSMVADLRIVRPGDYLQVFRDMKATNSLPMERDTMINHSVEPFIPKLRRSFIDPSDLGSISPYRLSIP